MTRAVMQQRLGNTITRHGEMAVVLANGIGTSQHTWPTAPARWQRGAPTPSEP